MRDRDPRQSLAFRWKLSLARAADYWERLWPQLMAPLGVVALFLIVSLLGLWSFMPGWLHGVVLVVLAGAFGFGIWRAFRQSPWATREDGLRRMEQASHLSHRPLRALDDTAQIAATDASSEALWQAHKRRLRALVNEVRIGMPRSAMPRIDPRAYRVAVALLVVVATVQATGRIGTRMAQAFQPGFQDRVDQLPVEIAIWATPPAYTNLPPQKLRTDQVEAPRLPEGTEVLAQVHHLSGTADQHTLAIDQQEESFTASGEGSAEATLTLINSGDLVISYARGELARVPVKVMPDLTPTISFNGMPEVTHRGVLRPGVEASDDFGLTEIDMLLALENSEEVPEQIELRRYAPAKPQVDERIFLDLTPHKYAGLPVILRLRAKDGLGQTGFSKPLNLILPERDFQHPLARAIIEQRRHLAAHPEQRQTVGGTLNRLSAHEWSLKAGSAVVLALRAAGMRLFVDPEDNAVDEVIDLLWDTALHVEDGALSLAEKNLRQIQEELERALQEGASDEEIERLMAELERAIDEFLEAMMREALENNPQALQQQMPENGEAMMMEQRDLQQMLEAAREMLRTGARDAAEQMLAELRNMLENLQAMPMTGEQQQGMEMMSELQDLIKQQQRLLDQTFQMNQQRMTGEMSTQPGSEGEQQMRAAGEAQEQLRRQLGELMRRLGESGVPIPRALGEAELSMREAGEALRQGEPGNALGPEGDALDRLQQGGQAMMQAMQEQFGPMGRMTGQNQQPGQESQGQRDPLGRAPVNEGGLDRFGDYVPDALDLGRAREILEELYRRAGEADRPAYEREYIERLLDRF